MFSFINRITIIIAVKQITGALILASYNKHIIVAFSY